MSESNKERTPEDESALAILLMENEENFRAQSSWPFFWGQVHVQFSFLLILVASLSVLAGSMFLFLEQVKNRPALFLVNSESVFDSESTLSEVRKSRFKQFSRLLWEGLYSYDSEKNNYSDLSPFISDTIYKSFESGYLSARKDLRQSSGIARTLASMTKCKILRTTRTSFIAEVELFMGLYSGSYFKGTIRTIRCEVEPTAITLENPFGLKVSKIIDMNSRKVK